MLLRQVQCKLHHVCTDLRSHGHLCRCSSECKCPRVAIPERATHLSLSSLDLNSVNIPRLPSPPRDLSRLPSQGLSPCCKSSIQFNDRVPIQCKRSMASTKRWKCLPGCHQIAVPDGLRTAKQLIPSFLRVTSSSTRVKRGSLYLHCDALCQAVDLEVWESQSVVICISLTPSSRGVCVRRRSQLFLIKPYTDTGAHLFPTQLPENISLGQHVGFRNSPASVQGFTSSFRQWPQIHSRSHTMRCECSS